MPLVSAASMEPTALRHQRGAPSTDDDACATLASAAETMACGALEALPMPDSSRLLDSSAAATPRPPVAMPVPSRADPSSTPCSRFTTARTALLRASASRSLRDLTARARPRRRAPPAASPPAPASSAASSSSSAPAGSSTKSSPDTGRLSARSRRSRSAAGESLAPAGPGAGAGAEEPSAAAAAAAAARSAALRSSAAITSSMAAASAMSLGDGKEDPVPAMSSGTRAISAQADAMRAAFSTTPASPMRPVRPPRAVRPMMRLSRPRTLGADSWAPAEKTAGSSLASGSAAAPGSGTALGGGGSTRAESVFTEASMAGMRRADGFSQKATMASQTGMSRVPAARRAMAAAFLSTHMAG
mmetsp:Transcript_982/g.3770  ORF Transcript_982/g.3770 Transcript_982/m.3770 type:complete len:359 (-) Transcript_982:791-1867(-)